MQYLVEFLMLKIINKYFLKCDFTIFKFSSKIAKVTKLLSFIIIYKLFLQ